MWQCLLFSWSTHTVIGQSSASFREQWPSVEWLWFKNSTLNTRPPPRVAHDRGYLASAEAHVVPHRSDILVSQQLLSQPKLKAEAWEDLQHILRPDCVGNTWSCQRNHTGASDYNKSHKLVMKTPIQIPVNCSNNYHCLPLKKWSSQEKHHRQFSLQHKKLSKNITSVEMVNKPKYTINTILKHTFLDCTEVKLTKLGLGQVYVDSGVAA